MLSPSRAAQRRGQWYGPDRAQRRINEAARDAPLGAPALPAREKSRARIVRTSRQRASALQNSCQCDGIGAFRALGGVEARTFVDGGFLDDATMHRLRQVLVARYGWHLGTEAWQDVAAYAWEHRARVGAMANPVGYLYRVAQSSVRRQLRWQRRVELPEVPSERLPDIEPGLSRALASLTARQRVAVMLVHAHGWTHDEAAVV